MVGGGRTCRPAPSGLEPLLPHSLSQSTVSLPSPHLHSSNDVDNNDDNDYNEYNDDDGWTAPVEPPALSEE